MGWWFLFSVYDSLSTGFLEHTCMCNKCIHVQVETNPNGTVRYCDFLEKFGGLRWTKINKDLTRSADSGKAAESVHQ